MYYQQGTGTVKLQMYYQGDIAIINYKCITRGYWHCTTTNVLPAGWVGVVLQL